MSKLTKSLIGLLLISVSLTGYSATRWADKVWTCQEFFDRNVIDNYIVSNDASFVLSDARQVMSISSKCKMTLMKQWLDAKYMRCYIELADGTAIHDNFRVDCKE